MIRVDRLRRNKRQRRRKRFEHLDLLNLHVSMCRLWMRTLVDIPTYHDRDDRVLLFCDDEEERNESLDGFLRKGPVRQS